MVRLVCVTRQSPLALRQASLVKAFLENAFSELSITLMPMITEGDRLLDVQLSRFGGKGLFVKELDRAILEGKADFAVHSLKDLPIQLIPELQLAALGKRSDPADVLLSLKYSNLQTLPETVRFGTASLRRTCQLKHRYPLSQIQMLRGNVGTRLAALESGQFDAIILAASGLSRLGITAPIIHRYDPRELIPAPGQGVLGLVCRLQDHTTQHYLKAFHDVQTEYCVRAERTFNATLEGGCHAPIAAYAETTGEQLILRGGVYHETRILEAKLCGSLADPETLGNKLAHTLLEQGAREILNGFRE